MNSCHAKHVALNWKSIAPFGTKSDGIVGATLTVPQRLFDSPGLSGATAVEPAAVNAAIPATAAKSTSAPARAIPEPFIGYSRSDRCAHRAPLAATLAHRAG